jgi:hypothetical protein
MQRTRSRLTILALLGLGLCGVGYRVVHTADEVPGSGAIAAAARPLEGAATPEAAALAELRRDLAQLRVVVERAADVGGRATMVLYLSAGT